MGDVRILRAGMVEHTVMAEEMKRLQQLRIENKITDTLIMVEHPEVVTVGPKAIRDGVVVEGYPTVNTDRGGGITWHGPGQLICYLVIDLNNRKRDIRKFINIIENSIIRSLKSFSIDSFSDRKNIGIWSKLNNKDKKVGAIGIKVKRWIAYHGFSININNDISNYQKIVPCGIKDKGITTLKKIKSRNYNKLSDLIIKNLVTNLKI